MDLDLKKYTKKIIVILLVLCAMAGFHISAYAYVLQGPHILELMTQKYGKAKRLLVSQKLVLFDDDKDKGTIELDETIRYIFPEEFRSDILSENTKRVHIISKGIAVTVIDDTFLSFKFLKNGTKVFGKNSFSITFPFSPSDAGTIKAGIFSFNILAASKHFS